MPVDLSKSHSDRRRLNRDAAASVRQDGMYSREIEMKRNRGEISCAECRRCVIGQTLCTVLLSSFLARETSFLLILSCLFFFFSSTLDLRLSVTNKSPVNHARYVPRNVALPPGEFSLTTPHSGEGVPLCVRTVR